MEEWIKLAEWMLKDTREEKRHFNDGHLLAHILKGQMTMALDLTALTAAIAKLSADVDTLITDAGSTPQSAIDAITTSVTSVSTKAEAAIAALNPPAAPATPAA